jgi:hypothetical protein
MAMQLKTGADLNNMPLSRFVIENLISDPTNNLKEGSKYYNAGSGTNSHRERIYSNGMWRSTAYMDDIDALQKQLDELDFAGSEEFQSLSGRVLTIEGLFNNGNAKNAEKLGGQLPSYYAEAEMVEQLREDFDDLYKTLNDDTTGVINTWQEVVDFVNEYSGSEDLSTILAAMNEDIEARALKSEVDSTFVTVNNNLSTIGGRVGSLETLTSNHTSQIADRYTKTETNTLLDAKADWSATIPENAFKAIGYGRPAEKWKYNGPALSFGANAIYFAQLQIDFNTNNIEFRRHTEEGFQPWRAFIHSGNYSNQITKLNNTLSVPSINIGGVVLDIVDGNLRISGNAYATGELGSGKIAEEGGGGSTGGGYTAFDDTYSWDKYDSSMADWLLTAYHGNRFNDRINELENKATKVEVYNLLTSGTKIATIKVDSNAYDILAPSTEWNAIINRPTKLSDFIDDVVAGNYLPLNSNAASATKLADNKAYSIWGQTFFENGKPKKVDGNLSLPIALSTGKTGEGIRFVSTDGAAMANIKGSPSGGIGVFTKTNFAIRVYQDTIVEGETQNKGLTVGPEGTTIHGNFGVDGYLMATGEGRYDGLIYANGGVEIPSTKTLQIGDAIISYEDGALKVNKNFFAEGEVASGKVGEEGTGGNTPSGSGLEIKTFDIASTTENQMVECVHSLGTRNVVVQIFENSQSSNYQQVFADVYYVDNTRVKINFGSAQTVPHRVIIMG